MGSLFLFFCCALREGRLQVSVGVTHNRKWWSTGWKTIYVGQEDLRAKATPCGQRTTWGSSSSVSPMCTLGIGFRSSDLATTAFSHQTISLVPAVLLYTFFSWPSYCRITWIQTFPYFFWSHASSLSFLFLSIVNFDFRPFLPSWEVPRAPFAL